MKKEKSQPNDTTGEGTGGSLAPQSKDSYQSKAKGQHHQMPKKRQDGKGSAHGPNAGDYLWTQSHSEHTHSDIG